MDHSPRRRFLQQIALAAGAAALPAASHAAQHTSGLLLPPRLKAGDTLGLISPSNATYRREPLTVAIESLQALGFKVKEAPHLRSRYGQFGGTDTERVGDINAMFADPEVHGILAMTGGSGATRLLDRIDYAAIRRHPKVLMGFSDITALLNAIHQQTGLITFHGPVAGSEWNTISVDSVRRVLMNAEAATFRNPAELSGGLVQTQYRVQTLRGGKARGKLVGGNLTVLTTLMGTPMQPDFKGAVLFLEDINEEIYRIDRMLAHLRLAGAFKSLAGVALGQFTDCGPGEGGYGTLTLDEVFDEYFKDLGIPVYSGAMIGHIKPKFALPVGLPVEIDADAGTLAMLSPAVR
ncbi:LD-carboxypeptidase [Chitinimonas sp. BJYL2]|uniref:S66 peptidase family protein n=1 Tax=Chitinimonas sp. BJYL2 TaxID=2976696 RepID=UPI0022B4FCA0|nr:LD-carboxypeptidase [Chitinimonas sp. BJYL2]